MNTHNKTFRTRLIGAAALSAALSANLTMIHAEAPSRPGSAGIHSNVAAEAKADVAAMKTFSSVGKGLPVLNGYKEVELLNHSGKGCLTHMWFGGKWAGYEQTRIRVYVDGEQAASIDMEMGMGHGYGFGDSAAPWGSEKMGKTGNPSGIYNTYQIPFGKSVRVTAQRAKSSPDGDVFWWIVRGTDNRPVTIGGVRLPEKARLRLYKLENHDAKVLEEFNLCDVAGAGMLYQVAISARRLPEKGGFGFMEGCMRAYFGFIRKKCV